MTMTNWDELDAQYGQKYKDYAPAGEHEVTLTEVKIHEVGSKGSIAQDFIFSEDDKYAYPKATHWLSFKNDGWRKHHNKNLMVLLGATEDQAKKAVDACESKDGKDNIVKAYADAYKRLASKNPKVTIEVWKDGKYKVSEFVDGSVRMNHPSDNTAPTPIPDDGMFENAEPVNIDDDLIPF